MKKNILPSALITLTTAGMLLGCTGAADSEPDEEPVREALSAIAITGQISSGENHTCAIVEDHTVRCWGGNVGWQLGDGTNIDRATPVPVVDPANPGDMLLANVVALSAGYNDTCAIVSGGRAYCWGAGGGGRLGNGTQNTYRVPERVHGLTDAVAIAAGYLHTCAVRAGGSVLCWGDNLHGQLGAGQGVPFSFEPVAVVGITDAVAIAVGHYFSCAVRAGGGVKCWGDNTYGALGNDPDDDIGYTYTPVDVAGVTNAISITAGGRHACARLNDWTVKCWGQNTSGQLGAGFSSFNETAVPVPGLAHVASLSAGSEHTCAVGLLNAGPVQTYCWGAGGGGQLGNGSTMDLPDPQLVQNLTGAARVSTGNAFSCASLGDGSAKCWGNNAVSQLGHPGVGTMTTPVDVLGL